MNGLRRRQGGAAGSAAAALLSVAARIPAALLPVAVMAAVGLTTRSLFTTGIAVSAVLTGLALSGSLASAAAERFGRRPVLLAGAVAHVIAVVLLVTAVDRFTQQGMAASDLALFLTVVGFAAAAGLTVPPVNVVSASRRRHLDRAPHNVRDGGAAPGRSAGPAESMLEDAALLLAPVLTAVLVWTAHPTAGLLAAAAITAVAVPLYAMDAVIGAMDEHSSGPQPGELQEEHDTPLRVMLPGMEQAQHAAVDGFPAQAQDAAPQHRPAAFPALSLLAPALPGAVLLGAALPLIWLVALGGAAGVYRGSWYAFLIIGALTLCGAIAARWLPRSLLALRPRRRRRLLTSMLVLVLLLILLLAAVLPGWPLLLALTLAAALAGLCAGALLTELHRGLAEQPAEALGAQRMLFSGAVLAGQVLGFAAGGAMLDTLR